MDEKPVPLEEPELQPVPPAKRCRCWLMFPLLALLIAGGYLWLNLQQSQRDAAMSQRQHDTSMQIASDKQHATLLADYTASIATLLIQDKLLQAKAGDAVRAVANARTKETLRALDPQRKAALMRFLYTTQLINNDYHVIDLSENDLHAADLANGDLRDTYLLGANFSGANLSKSNLTFATLVFTNFSGANLSGANLSASDMHNVNLNGADLTGANLKDATGISVSQLAHARSLAGATLPDGSIHP